MPNYKELYLKMFRASDRAIRILIAAQQECEELYISQSESEQMLAVVPLDKLECEVREFYDND